MMIKNKFIKIPVLYLPENGSNEFSKDMLDMGVAAEDVYEQDMTYISVNHIGHFTPAYQKGGTILVMTYGITLHTPTPIEELVTIIKVALA